MTRPSLLLALGLTALAACGTSLPTAPDPDYPGLLRGVRFERPPTTADSAALARFGRVVAVVRPDSVVLLESELSGQEAYAQLSEVPGVRVVGPARWESDTSRLEVWLTRYDGNLSRARAVLERLGATGFHEFPATGSVASHVPAYRLAGLNDLGDYERIYREVRVAIDPPVAMGRTRR